MQPLVGLPGPQGGSQTAEGVQARLQAPCHTAGERDLCARPDRPRSEHMILEACSPPGCTKFFRQLVADILLPSWSHRLGSPESRLSDRG